MFQHAPLKGSEWSSFFVFGLKGIYNLAQGNAPKPGSLFFQKQMTKIYFTRRNGQPRGPLQAALAVVPTYHVETNSD